MDKLKFAKDLDTLFEHGTVVTITLVPHHLHEIVNIAARNKLHFDTVLNRLLFLSLQFLETPDAIFHPQPLLNPKGKHTPHR